VLERGGIVDIIGWEGCRFGMDSCHWALFALLEYLLLCNSELMEVCHQILT
jgi:hypothetical protein